MPTTLSRIYFAKFSWPGDVLQFLSIVNHCVYTLPFHLLRPSSFSFPHARSACSSRSSLSTVHTTRVFLFFLLLCSPRSLALFHHRRCCLPFSYSSGVYPRRNGRSVSAGTKHNVTRSCVRALLVPRVGACRSERGQTNRVRRRPSVARGERRREEGEQ